MAAQIEQRGGADVDAYNTEIARWSGFDSRTIERVLPRLVAEGWLRRTSQGHARPPLYQLGARFEQLADDAGPLATSGGGAAPAPAPSNVVRFPTAARTPPPERETAPLSASARVYTRADASQNAHSPRPCAPAQRALALEETRGVLDAVDLTAPALAGFRAARLAVHGTSHCAGATAPDIARRLFGEPAAELLAELGRDVTEEAVELLATVGAAWWMQNVPGHKDALRDRKHAIGLLAGDDGRDAEAIRDAMARHLAPKVTEAPPPLVAPADPEEGARQRAANVERLRAMGLDVPAYQAPRRAAGGSR